LGISPLFNFFATFLHSLGFTALLLLAMVALIVHVVIQSVSSLIGLNGRRGQLSSLIGCTVSLYHVRYLQLPIFENVYSILMFLDFRFQNRRYCVPSQTEGYLHFFIVGLTLFQIQYVGNYLKKKNLHISLKYATTFVRNDQFKDELFYSSSSRLTWKYLPALAQG
jgi:hypothetical protein